MAIPTSRTKETAEIAVKADLCNGCGLCVTACSDFSLTLENGKAVKSKHALFGCIGCGQIQNGKKAKKFREEHGIRFKSREGLFVIFGYPALKFEKGIRRTFANINRILDSGSYHN